MNDNEVTIGNHSSHTFPQLNAKANLPAEHKTSLISVKRLKHGHLRNMQRMNEGRSEFII